MAGKGFKYMGYINALFGGYKKVIKRLLYLSPLKKCFHADVLSNMSEPLRQSF